MALHFDNPDQLVASRYRALEYVGEDSYGLVLDVALGTMATSVFGSLLAAVEDRGLTFRAGLEELAAKHRKITEELGGDGPVGQGHRSGVDD